MIRSLLVGFLILSALTTKGAGFQIVNNLNITPEMLPDIINAAVSSCAEISGVPSADRDILAKKNYSHDKYKKAYKTIRNGFEYEFSDQALPALPAVRYDDSGLCGSVICLTPDHVLPGESGLTSGLSPPYKQ